MKFIPPPPPKETGYDYTPPPPPPPQGYDYTPPPKETGYDYTPPPRGSELSSLQHQTETEEPYTKFFPSKIWYNTSSATST